MTKSRALAPTPDPSLQGGGAVVDGKILSNAEPHSSLRGRGAETVRQTLPLRGRVGAQRPGGVQRARSLRKNMTDAEKKMWHILRDLDWPLAHFRRQVKIGPYFADFLTHRYKLIVEVDGSQHAEGPGLNHDTRRTAFLNKEGFDVIRYFNIDVLTNAAGVHDAIEAKLHALTPTPDPSPQGGGAETTPTAFSFGGRT